MVRELTCRQVLAEAALALTPISDTPRLDAELLMAHALRISREDLLLRHLDAPAPGTFDALLARRLVHEPIAYITGTRAFWTIDIAVGPGALIPRADSETLIEAAIDHFGAAGPASILDLGTGPGTLLLAALSQWTQATGVGIDRSDAALAMAKANADRLSLADRVTFSLGDWADGIDRRFDLILANPPYIGTSETLPRDVAAYEPREALFAGEDGLDDYRIIVPQLPHVLKPGGIAALEIGHTQADAVSALVEAVGLMPSLRRDLAGRPRAMIAR